MQKNDPPKQRGRKPIGDKAMTAAERQQRRRAAIKADGAKAFVMHIAPMHLVWIERAAAKSGMPLHIVLTDVLERALDRFAGVMKRVAFLELDCNNPHAAAAFIETHLSPPVPSLEALAAQFKKEDQ